MNSSLFEAIGLGDLDIAYLFIGLIVIILILFILLIIALLKISNLTKRYDRLMRGANAKSMEKQILGLFDDIEYLKHDTIENKREIKHIYKRLETTFQKIGLVKYDAFNQMGGRLSYALALLDENNNGFIVNSVHGTDGSYSYTKEIHGGECEISLGAEEEKALTMAMQHEFGRS